MRDQISGIIGKRQEREEDKAIDVDMIEEVKLSKRQKINDPVHPLLSQTLQTQPIAPAPLSPL